MLPSIGIVKIILKILEEFPVQGKSRKNSLLQCERVDIVFGIYTHLWLKTALVVDPVMVSTSGDILAGPSVLDCFR